MADLILRTLNKPGDTTKNSPLTSAEVDQNFINIDNELATKAPSASPALTGTPTAPTAAAGTNTTQVATTAFVHAERTNTATLTNKTLTTPTLSNTASGTTAGRVGYDSGSLTFGDGTAQRTVATTDLDFATGYPTVLPSLNLDFANSKTLDPRITFTRASSATYYDGKTVAKAEENLLLWSQEFDNAAWSKINATVTTNTQVAPDGTTTADTLTDNNTSGVHRIERSATSVTGTWVFSVFAKAGTATWLHLRNNTLGVGVWFDVANGVLGTQNSGYVGSIASVGNGWYRCSVVSSASIGSALGISIADADGNASYVGTGSTLHIWGAQLEQRSAVTAYIPTTDQPITNYVPVLLSAPANVARFDHNPVTGESLGLLIEEQRPNLLLYSERFDDAYWTKIRSDIAANTVIAPDGTLTADTLTATETNANGAGFVKGNITVSGSQQTLSVYIKRGNSNFVIFNAFDGAATNGARQWFDIQNGTLGGTVTFGTGWSIASASITSVGNGWYRCSAVVNISGTRFDFVVHPAVDANLSFGATIGNYAYIWGAQLESGAFPTSYIKTEASQVTRSADSATMTGTNFSSWYRQDEGTMFAVSRCGGIGGGGAGASFHMLGNSGQDGIGVNQYLPSKTRVGVAAVANVIQSIFEAAVTYPTGYLAGAFGYKTNDFGAARDGAVPGTDTSGNLPVVIRAGIGCQASGGQQLNGHVKRITYWPKRLTNSELQAITAQ